MKPNALYFFLLFLPCSIFAQLSDYDWKVPLGKTSDTWHTVPLPVQVFENTKNDLSDIRIYGVRENDTLEVPFVLQSSAPNGIAETVDFKLLNSTFNENGYFFTYAIPTDQAINRIALSFENANFDWQVALEGSHDQNQWFTILEDYRMVSIKNSQTSYTFTDLKFPEAKYAYFRIFIKADEKPELTGSKIVLNKVIPGSLVDYPTAAYTISQDGKATLIEIDLKRRLPVSYLKVNVMDAYEYYRPMSVSYVSDSVETEKGWKYTYRNLFTNTLTSLDDAGFTFGNTLMRKLKIRIENYDNPPLKIGTTAIKGYSYKLLGRFTEPADYYLVYGNATASEPLYDLQQVGFQLPANASTLVLGSPEKIDRPVVLEQAPLFENKWWLWGIMGLIILVLGASTLKMMKEKG